MYPRSEPGTDPGLAQPWVLLLTSLPGPGPPSWEAVSGPEQRLRSQFSPELGQISLLQPRRSVRVPGLAALDPQTDGANSTPYACVALGKFRHLSETPAFISRMETIPGAL